MYKIAVLGDRDSVYGFAALGLEIRPVQDAEEAAKEFRRLADGGYAVIYVTEAAAEMLGPEIDRCAGRKLPAVIPIPGISGNTGSGMRNVKAFVEKAVGSDIIFGGNNEKAGEKE